MSPKQWAKHAALAAIAVGAVAAAGCPAPVRAPPPPPPPAPVADLVLTGGAVRTPDGVVEALAVKGGRIAEVGPAERVATWIGPATKVVDLKGATAVPGLVDAHMHLIGLGKRRLSLDLIGIRTLAELKARVAAAAKSAPPGQWILGRGWDQNDWTDHDGFPDAADLDAVAPDHPVALTRVDGHALWANTAAMARAEIGPSTRAAPGGRIVKRKGRPTGIFVDNAMDLIRRHVPALTPAQLEQAVLRGQDECLAAGLTGVHDMGVGLDELAVMKRLDEQGRLHLRVYAAHDGMVEDLAPALAEPPRIPAFGGPERLTVRAVKFYADGALGSRGAALLADYSDDPGNQGLLLTDPVVLEARVRTARDRGYQPATHAIGDRANRTVLDIYRRVYGASAWRARPRIEHAQVVALDDLPRFAAEGVIASVQPTHATSDMPWAEDRVGPTRVKGAYAWQTLLTSSATVANGSDAPVEAIAPLLGLYAARFRRDQLGRPEGGWYPDQAMSGEQALAAFTRGAAWAGFAEAHLGRLAEGQLADITVLSADPTTAPEAELLSTQVRLTIVQGEIRYAADGADAPPVTTTATVAAR